jgi:hypothetical protein
MAMSSAAIAESAVTRFAYKAGRWTPLGENRIRQRFGHLRELFADAIRRCAFVAGWPRG